jgi:hypothetical protein
MPGIFLEPAIRTAEALPRLHHSGTAFGQSPGIEVSTFAGPLVSAWLNVASLSVSFATLESIKANF